MKIYSFDKTKLKRIDNLYDIFEKNIIYSRDINLFKYIIPKEHDMRLDLISKEIYGSSDYIEELMLINNIMSPYSVKEGQEIYFCPYEQLNVLYTKDDMLENNDIRENILKAAQPKRRATGDNLLPTNIKPKNIKQVTIDTKNRKIKIMNSFK